MSKTLENYNKFGAPLHPSMDREDLTESWGTVDESIRNKHTSITQTLESLNVVGQIEAAVNNTYTQAKTLFDTTRATVEAAAAATQGNTVYVAQKGIVVGAKNLLQNQTSVLEGLKSSIF